LHQPVPVGPQSVGDSPCLVTCDKSLSHQHWPKYCRAMYVDVGQAAAQPFRSKPSPLDSRIARSGVSTYEPMSSSLELQGNGDADGGIKGGEGDLSTDDVAHKTRNCMPYQLPSVSPPCCARTNQLPGGAPSWRCTWYLRVPECCCLPSRVTKNSSPNG